MRVSYLAYLAMREKERRERRRAAADAQRPRTR
ncbi:hypothetical protein MPTA5024_12450 [Microbispora sp. ATCC PTA-5024]|nr:hypothetical protein MPTA5024_12450 [Microbispora sp. ATCC PTA-5024]